MTCQYDRDIQCFEDCDDCSRYKSEIMCPECDTLTLRSELEKYNGMYRQCKLCQDFDNGVLLEEFFEANPDIEQAYKEFIDEVWYQ